MTAGDHLMMALALVMHHTHVCHQRLLQGDVDRDRLIADLDQLYGDIVRLIVRVMQATALPTSSLMDSPDGRVTDTDDEHSDKRDLIAVLRSVYGHAAFVRSNSTVDEREYVILAEYVDGLHDELAHLMTLLSVMQVIPATPRTSRD